MNPLWAVGYTAATRRGIHAVEKRRLPSLLVEIKSEERRDTVAVVRLVDRRLPSFCKEILALLGFVRR